MTKTDLVKEVAKKTGLRQPEVLKVINSLSETVKEKLMFGMNVTITDFVSFKIGIIKEREIKIPSTQELITVPKHYKVKLKMPLSFVEEMKQKTVY